MPKPQINSIERYHITNQQIIDSIYLIPVLLDFMDAPSRNTAAILKSYGINRVQLEEMRQIRSLLEYHHDMIRNNFKGNYPLLRKGLVEYFNSNLSEIFVEAELTNLVYHVLDFGCGAGQVSDLFLANNPASTVVKIDKDNSIDPENIIAIDFEEDPFWYGDYIAKFDCVILSEVLHCKKLDGQKSIIDTCFQVLNDKGILLIIENVDPCMEYRINKIKQDNEFKLLDREDVFELMKDTGFVCIQTKLINLHRLYEYAKV